MTNFVWQCLIAGAHTVLILWCARYDGKWLEDHRHLPDRSNGTYCWLFYHLVATVLLWLTIVVLNFF